MPKLVARCITISLDGFSAAKGQSLDAPFGKDGLRLMEWTFATRYFARMIGQEGGAGGLDNDFLVRSDDNIGATILVTHDHDFKGAGVSQRLGITQRQYRTTLHRIVLRCSEPDGAARIASTMPLLEFEWANLSASRPLFVEIYGDSIKIWR